MKTLRLIKKANGLFNESISGAIDFYRISPNQTGKNKMIIKINRLFKDYINCISYINFRDMCTYK